MKEPSNEALKEVLRFIITRDQQTCRLCGGKTLDFSSAGQRTPDAPVTVRVRASSNRPAAFVLAHRRCRAKRNEIKREVEAVVGEADFITLKM